MSNPAIAKFMARKAPKPPGAEPKLPKKINEEESLISYAKDISGTILMSPLTSAVRTQLGETASRMLSRMDIFKSIHKIGSVKSPTFVMHGESDSVVPCSHGRALYRMLPPEAKVFAPWWAKRRGHNDMPEAEVLRRVSDFIQALKQIRQSNEMSSDHRPDT